MPSRHITAFAGALLALAASSARAQTRAQARADSANTDTAYHLPGVRVQALRAIATGDGGSALQIRLDSLHIPVAPTLDQALRDVPFMQVRTNPRGEAYFALRGSSFNAREVAVLVDGVPMSLNFDHRADLSLLPATGAQTLTVVRGLPSLLYGPNVLGGVVDVGIARVPLADADSDHLRFDSGIDHTGAYRLASGVNVEDRAGSGTLLVRAGGGYRHSLGFPLPPGATEPPPYTARDTRLNSYGEQGDGYLAARYEGDGGGWMSLSSSGYSARRGVPAEIGSKSPQLLQYPAERRSFSVLSLGSGARRSPFGGWGSLEANVGYDGGRTELNGFTARTYTTIKSREADDDHDLTSRIVADQTIAGGGDLHAAATYADVRRHEALAPGGVSDYSQRLWSGATELGWRLPNVASLSALRASAGVALDAADTPDTAGKPAVGTLHAWGGRLGLTGATDGGRVLLHAGVNRRVRFPSLRELYSGPLNMIQPNPNLRPEQMVATEAGATVGAGAAQLQGVLFHNEIHDEIVSSTTAAKKVERINRDRTTSTGVELLASVPLGPASIGGDVTAQSVTGRNPAAAQDYRAEYQPKFAGGVRASAPIPLGAELSLGTRMVGTQYCVDASSPTGYDRLAASARTSVALSRRWTRRDAARSWFRSIESTIAADDAGDETIYDQCGLPQPGRVIRFELRLR